MLPFLLPPLRCPSCPYELLICLLEWMSRVLPFLEMGMLMLLLLLLRRAREWCAAYREWSSGS